MDRTAVQRAMWDRLEAEKNELKVELGGRVDRLYDRIKLEVELVYGHVETGGREDIAPIEPRSPSPLITLNESPLNSIDVDNVDTSSNIHNCSITPPTANSTDQITHQTTEHHSTRTEQQLVNLIEVGQNVDSEQSSLPLADIASNFQPSSIHRDNRQIEANSVPFDSHSNMSHSTDHPQPDNSQPNTVSHGSLTDATQNAKEMQPQIKQEFSDEATSNRNEQSNGGDFVKYEYFSDDNDCDSDCDCDCHGKHDRPSRPVTRTPNGTTQKIKEEEDAENESTNNEQTVTQSSGDLFAPSTSTGQVSNRKRKQPTSNPSAKRSKITLQDDDEEDEEDIANEDRDETKVIVLSLNCTESNCNAKLGSMRMFNDHLTTAHQLSPHRCFATNCGARFDNRIQMRDHVQLSHSHTTRFLCEVCSKEYDSQQVAYRHWYYYHRTGRFKCNLVSNCAQVTDAWSKMKTHQKTKHHSQPKNFHCAHPGCTAPAFRDNYALKLHERTHVNSKPFRCSWPHCRMCTKQRGNLIVHIRTQHFGLPKSMKEQEEENIVDVRDPNEYVLVVADE